jgi:hypothetical protein
MDRRDKLIQMEAMDYPLVNKLARASRRKMKRMASKAVRQDIRQRRDLDD